jgi:hypothetical protein
MQQAAAEAALNYLILTIPLGGEKQGKAAQLPEHYCQASQ